MTTRDDSKGEEPPCCKLGRAIERYDLGGLDEELTERWRGAGGERSGVRDLADRVNVAILSRALDDAGVTPLDGDTEHLYHRLTDDGVGSGTRTELRSRLESKGVDLDAVESRFVSHQTVHTHLTECLGVSRADDDRSPAERRSDELDRIRALQSRTEAVTVDSLDRLDRKGDIDLPSFDVLVDVAILCERCGRRTELGDILERGACRCETGN